MKVRSLKKSVKRITGRNVINALKNCTKPNAVLVSSNIMAPALTEPLSPTEKLSSSTATATPVTRLNKKIDPLTPSLSITSASGKNIAHREKRKRTLSRSSTLARVTRSKDAHQKVFENLVTVSGSTSQAPTIYKSQDLNKSLNNNEQMGLSAALDGSGQNNNNNNDFNTTNTNKKIKDDVESANCRDNSTEQLLADLTTEFEEAKTAEICLRKQLVDINLIGVIETKSHPKRKLGTTVGSGAAPDPNLQAHMESQTTYTRETNENEQKTRNDKSEKLNLELETQQECSSYIVEKSEKTEFVMGQQRTENQSQPQPQLQPQLQASHKEHEKGSAAVEPITSESTATIAEELNTVQKTDSNRLQILSVEELPPVNTDSTMTASEVGDNLEERLSQLDGTAIISPTCDNIPATPPTTPTKQQQHVQEPQDVHQQVQELQQQLQQTPPAQLTQQPQQQHHSVQNSFTPQSTSSINTLSSSNLTQAFMKESTGADLEDQDIEEVLKALKGFDGSAGTDTLCDLNVFFNEVYTTLNYEEISSQPISSSLKPNPLKEMQVEIERMQQKMQRSVDFLLRRLRKIQSRHMSKHTSEEIAGLLEYSARFMGKGGGGGGAGSSSTGALTNDGDGIGVVAVGSLSDTSVIAARPHALNWAEEKKNPVPSAQMTSLLRKLETASNAQQLCTSFNQSIAVVHTNLRKSKKANQEVLLTPSSPAMLLPSVNEHNSECVVPKFDANVSEELAHVAGLLQVEMREVQNAYDSDATESSSGGESADEMVTYNNQIQQPLSIGKRAAWRFSRDRAAIASRWCWLLSQIADLEIKIRQHSELHQEIVQKKGSVICGWDGATSRSAPTAANQPMSSVNGYKSDISVGPMPVYNDSILKEESEAEYLPGSCRTRAYNATQFRKRKIYQTTNLHTISKKAARPSTIKCGCQWPLHSCAVCTGRSDPTAPRDLPDTMMIGDRVALLDAGYHSVLSFPEDVSNSIHLEAICRLPEWQQRVMRCQVKSIAKSVWKAEREAAAAAGHHSSRKFGGGDSTTKRRYIKKKDRLAAEGKNAAMACTTSEVPTVTETTTTTTSTTGGSRMMLSTTTTIPTSNDGMMDGNATGNSTQSTTPLVANRTSKISKKVHCHLVGDGILLEPLSPVASNNCNYIHQTSDYPLQNYDPFNPNQAHSSSISHNSNNKISKQRKLSTASVTAAYFNHCQYAYNNNTSNQYYNINGSGSGELHFLQTNENWDSFIPRSRNSSPTHGNSSSSSNYYKYERSLDRKNRSSYDIDNIVIPYSVAATTRVEILPYKEIPTPKWRIIDEHVLERGRGRGHGHKNDSSNATNKVEDKIMKSQLNDIGTQNASVTESALKKTLDVGTTTQNESQVKAEIPNEPIDGSSKSSSNGDLDSLKAAIDSNDTNENEIAREDESTLVNEKKIVGNMNIFINDINEEPKAKKRKVEMIVNKVTIGYADSETSGSAVLSTDFAFEKIVKSSDCCMFIDDGVEEDISDDAIILRHERALAEERRKFQTFLKFPWSTRSRANRRIDSRAESSGANTPDPTSPAPNTPSMGGGDQESIPSPCAPLTPLNPLENNSEINDNVLGAANSSLPLIPVACSTVGVNNLNCTNSKHLERRRTTSTKKEREFERRSSTPDLREFVPPYEPLKFPLTDEMLESLLQAMPSECNHSNDSKYFEDCHSTKSMRNRSSLWSDALVKRATKSTINCDSNNKRQRQNNLSAIHKIYSSRSDSSRGSGGGGGEENGASGFKTASTLKMNVANNKCYNFLHSKDKRKNGVDDVGDGSGNGDGDDDGDIGIGIFVDEDEDLDYPKHHLAADDDLYDKNFAENIGENYKRYERVEGVLHSDGESSEVEPFEDDDPNDPEWKGEGEERSERLRKKL